MVVSHIDDTLKKKIENHEYVDFARLLARDKILEEEDPGMRLVSKNGYLSIATGMSGQVRGQNAINLYAKWEQAFHVFYDIYIRWHPHKTGELNQYNYSIHTASNTYLWDNVYAYEKDFCIHMAKNEGYRTWAVILQLSWNLRLNQVESQQ